VPRTSKHNNGPFKSSYMYSFPCLWRKLINETHRIYDQVGDFGYLHGSSVRYGRFGYIANGVQYTCTLEPEKICGYEFLPIQKNEVEWHQSILVNKTDYINRTPEDFIPALSSQGRKALSVFKNGNLAGFISLSYEQGFIEEFCFADEIEKEVFKAIAHTLQRDVSVRLSGYDIKTLSRLKEFSDVKRSVPALFRIINDKPLKEAAASLGLEENVLYAPYFT